MIQYLFKRSQSYQISENISYPHELTPFLRFAQDFPLSASQRGGML
jgi:hypothetical protein